MPIPSNPFSSYRSPFHVTPEAPLEMHAMLEKYSTFTLPTTISSLTSSPRRRRVVLLTGSTGALGSHILDELLQDTSVSLVYCLNRRGNDSQSLLQRHLEGFKQKGLDPTVFRSYLGKWVMLEGDLTIENFGLEKSVFMGLAMEVTTIIHNGK